jgi:hypothetical protein
VYGLPRHSAPIAVLAAAAAFAVLAMTIGAQAAHAASRTCRLSQSEQFPRNGKPTYNLTLRASGTSCRTAKSVMRSFHSCRPRTAVRCAGKVRRNWTCSGRRTSSIPGQFNASFSCRWGARRVTGRYQQNVSTN